MYDALVIGGGITGLCCAYRLKGRGKKVCLIEPKDFGGAIKTSSRNGFTLEHGPNVMLMNEYIEELLTELGIRDKVINPRVSKYRQYVWFQGKPTNVPKGPIQFFTCPLFSPADRLLLLPRLFRRNILKPQAEDESVAVFFGRLVGPKTIEHLIDPALKGIYGGEAARLSARSLFSQLWEHAREGGSIVGYMKKRKRQGARKRELFVLEGGMRTLTQALVSKLAPEVTILQSTVSGLSRGNGTFKAVTAGGEPVEAREVYVTTSGSSTADYISTLSSSLAGELNKLRYAAIAVVHAAVPRTEPVPEDSFGVLFPAGYPLLGIMYNSSLFPHVAPADQHLLTICLGGSGQQQRVNDYSDAELERVVQAELEQRLGVRRVAVLNIQKWSHAIPQYEIGHYRLMDEMVRLEQQYQGLYFFGVDRPGISVPDRVKTVCQRLP